MSEGGIPGAPDLEQLARDWVTLWQSELAALAVDREAQENWQTLIALWAGVAATALRAAPRGPEHDPGPRKSGPHAAPGASAAAAAPDPRDAEIERLARRIEELERRLGPSDRPADAGDHRHDTG